ncbi:hypothetical protein L2E82_09763 [Cichorium intybus]|uniref:Uncharacterized protein n=1 Tax=Cichorium intybus TaxID=13427 RepID=A0ACB9GAD0_CICIN|nr:hypothetical protein L2E82_09763 [Cichorium intybus]
MEICQTLANISTPPPPLQILQSFLAFIDLSWKLKANMRFSEAYKGFKVIPRRRRPPLRPPVSPTASSSSSPSHSQGNPVFPDFRSPLSILVVSLQHRYLPSSSINQHRHSLSSSSPPFSQSRRLSGYGI